MESFMLLSLTLPKLLTNRILLLYKLQKRGISDMYYEILLALYSNVLYKVKVRGDILELVNGNCKSILPEARSFSSTEQDIPDRTNMEDWGKSNGVIKSLCHFGVEFSARGSTKPDWKIFLGNVNKKFSPYTQLYLSSIYLLPSLLNFSIHW